MTPAPVEPAAPPARASLAALAPPALVYLLLFAAVGAWSTFATVLFGEMGLGLAVIGVLASVPAAVSIVGAPAWGLVADRLGDVRPPLLVAGLWGAAMASLLWLGPTMPWVVVVVIALAAGTSGLTPLVDARTVERLGRDRDRYGQARAFGSAGFIVASLATGVIVERFGTPAMLAVYVPAIALTGIVGAAVLGRGTRRARAKGVGPLRALRMLRDPGMGLFFAGSVVIWIAATGVMTFFSLRLVELTGDHSLVGVGWAANAILEIPTMLAYRRVVARVRVEWLLVVGAAIFVLRGLMFAAGASPAWFIVGAALGGVGFGFFLVGTTTFIAQRAPVHLRATAQALFGSTAFAVGSIGGALLGGLVGGVLGLEGVFPVMTAVSALGTALIWLAVVRRGIPAAVDGATGRPARADGPAAGG